MITKFQKDVLFPLQLALIKQLEELVEGAPVDSFRVTTDLLNTNKTILYKIGYREPAKPKKAPSHPFPLQKTKGGMAVTISEQEAAEKHDKATPQRISKQLLHDIELLDKEKLSVSAISDKLMITEESISKAIAKLRKKNQPQNVILATGIKGE
jgi:hypothetical protein